MSGIVCPSYQAGFASPQRGRLKHESLWRGCIGAWAPCLGQSGSTLRDHSPYGNHGTLTSMDPATDWVSRNGTHALDFDGTNDWIDVTLPTGLISGPYSFGGWVYVDSIATTRTIFSVTDRASTIRFDILEIRSSQFSIAARNTVFTNTLFGSPVVGELVHVFCSGYSATNRRVFVNGNYVTTHTTSSNLLGANATGFIIGRSRVSVSTEQFDGAVVESHLFSRAVSDAEVKTLGSRPGIMYEQNHRRSYKSAAAPGVKAAWLNQRSQIIGGGAR